MVRTRISNSIAVFRFDILTKSGFNQVFKQENWSKVPENVGQFGKIADIAKQWVFSSRLNNAPTKLSLKSLRISGSGES